MSYPIYFCDFANSTELRMNGASFCFSAGDARHPGHDARGHQAEQGPHHPAAPQRGLEVLEGQHPLEGKQSALSGARKLRGRRLKKEQYRHLF